MISIIKRNYFPHRTETIFIEIFLTKAKPMTLDVIYRPPSRPNFLETTNIIYKKYNLKKIYIIAGFKINLYLNNKMYNKYDKCWILVSNIIPYAIRK